MPWQWALSLFTTGGKINPLAVVLLILTAFAALWTFNEFSHLRKELEIARQAQVVQDAAKDKVNNLNEARNELQNAEAAIDSGEFVDWLERVQRED